MRTAAISGRFGISTRRLRQFSIFIVFLLCAALGMAQLDTANISGTVTDQSGGAVPGASVTVRNVGTGVTRTLQTNAGGALRGACSSGRKL